MAAGQKGSPPVERCLACEAAREQGYRMASSSLAALFRLEKAGGERRRAQVEMGRA